MNELINYFLHPRSSPESQRSGGLLAFSHCFCWCFCCSLPWFPPPHCSFSSLQYSTVVLEPPSPEHRGLDQVEQSISLLGRVPKPQKPSENPVAESARQLTAYMEPCPFASIPRTTHCKHGPMGSGMRVARNGSMGQWLHLVTDGFPGRGRSL